MSPQTGCTYHTRYTTVEYELILGKHMCRIIYLELMLEETRSCRYEVIWSQLEGHQLVRTKREPRQQIFEYRLATRGFKQPDRGVVRVRGAVGV